MNKTEQYTTIKKLRDKLEEIEKILIKWNKELIQDEALEEKQQ